MADDDLQVGSAATPVSADASTGDTRCRKCGRPLPATHWVVGGQSLHLNCVDWKALPRPPLAFRSAELRRRHARLKAELEAIEEVGAALSDATRRWPRQAHRHALRIQTAVQRLDLNWPVREPTGSSGTEP